MKIDQRQKGSRTVPAILAISVAIFVLCVAASPAWALFGGKVEHFSADNVEIDPSGSVLHTSKLYVRDDAMRIDGLPGGGMGRGPAPNMSILVFKDKGKMYFYNHDKKLVFEGPMEDKDLGPGYKSLDNIESEKVLGNEKVSGYKCIKKEVVTSYGVVGRTFKQKLIIWESDKFEFPLRTKNEDGSMQEMRNIDEGKPSKKLFKLLPGYKKVDSMMAVMGVDFGKMMARKQARDEEQEAQTMPNPAVSPRAPVRPGAGQQNLENMDVKKMMEQMSQAMGKDMREEEKAQLMQVMAHAMNRAKETKEGPGAAKQIWQIIPMRPEDKIGAELKTTNMLNVTMGSKASLSTVFNFYKNKLAPQGWKDRGMFLQNDQGSMHMTKGDRSLTISSAENPGISGNYTQYYMIQIQGPDI